MSFSIFNKIVLHDIVVESIIKPVLNECLIFLFKLDKFNTMESNKCSKGVCCVHMYMDE